MFQGCINNNNNNNIDTSPTMQAKKASLYKTVKKQYNLYKLQKHLEQSPLKIVAQKSQKIGREG